MTDADWNKQFGDALNTILQNGGIYPDPELTQVLFDTVVVGADNFDINHRDRNQSTFLHKAAAWGNSAMCEFLTKYGADICARDNEDRTPIEESKDSCGADLEQGDPHGVYWFLMGLKKRSQQQNHKEAL